MRRPLKIFAVLLSICVISAVALGGCSLFKPTPNDPAFQMFTLDAPQDVYFNDGNFTLNWGAVDHAKSYEVKHNKTTVSVGKVTSKQIELQEGNNTFQVRAMGDDVTYNTSKWSEEVTYYYEQSIENKTVFEVVRDKIMTDGNDDGKEFIRIVGITYADHNNLTSAGANIIFETVWKEYGEENNIRMAYFVDNCADIEEVLDNFSDAQLTNSITYKTVDYNSAEYLIKSNDFVGYMNTLKEQGYTISVVDSVVREGSKVGNGFRFDIVGTYKAQLGDDVKYFSTIYEVLVAVNSPNPKDNYEDEVGYPADRTITQKSLVIHETAGTLSYVEEWASRLEG